MNPSDNNPSSSSSSSSGSSCKETSPKMTPQELTKNLKKIDKEKMAMIFSSSELIPALLSSFTRLSDQQMEWAIPYMTVDQVKQNSIS